MTKTTYRLVETYTDDDTVETDYASLGRALVALEERTQDLVVGDGYSVVRSSDRSRALNHEDDEPGRVSARLFIEEVQPLTLTDCTGWSREQFESFLA
jgi:hypothetical protein